MKTPTHLLVGYVSAKFLGFNRVQSAACMLGACLADLPLTLAYGYFWLKCYWQNGHYDGLVIKALMDEVYFANSWLLIAHNMFHSPISIGYLALICLIICGKDRRIRHIILAYLLGSFTHSLLDIISHIADGPLVWVILYP